MGLNRRRVNFPGEGRHRSLNPGCCSTIANAEGLEHVDQLLPMPLQSRLHLREVPLTLLVSLQHDVRSLLGGVVEAPQLHLGHEVIPSAQIGGVIDVLCPVHTGRHGFFLGHDRSHARSLQQEHKGGRMLVQE